MKLDGVWAEMSEIYYMPTVIQN